MAEIARKHLNAGSAFVVDCTHQSNVLVMDDQNYQAWERGDAFRYHGGFYRRFPAVVRVPHTGYWNVVLEAPNGARYGFRTTG